MSIVPVSILSSEQVVKVKHMFDETIIEKLNLLMHSHAIAEKDTKQHRELANFKERCEDEYNKDKCRVSADDSFRIEEIPPPQNKDDSKKKERIKQNDEYKKKVINKSISMENEEVNELLRYRETLLLQFLEYNKKKKLKSHLFVVFGGKVEDNQVYDELYDDDSNNNWVYRMNVEDNMNKLPAQFEGLYNKIKDKFIEYKVAKRKPAYTINDNDKPFESIVFLKASKSNYSIDFSRDKNIKTMPALLSKFDKEISFSKGQSKKLDEEIQKFVNKHNKYDFASNEQKIVDDRNTTTGSSVIMSMDLTAPNGSSSFQELMKDINPRDQKIFIEYLFNSRKPFFQENKKHFLFNVFDGKSDGFVRETIHELSKLAQLKRQEESISSNFHRMTIYVLQKYFNFYVLNQPMISDMFPLVSKDMQTFQVDANIHYMSKVRNEDKYYDKNIVLDDLKYPQKKTFYYKIKDTNGQDYFIHSIGPIIGNNLYPVEIVKKPGNKEVPIKYSMILKTKDLPLMVELKLQDKNPATNKKEKIKGLLFVDEMIQTSDKTFHTMKPSKIYPTNKANHFFYKPKFEANQNALADYLKKPKISDDEYKKKLCEVFTSKENLSKFFMFCQNNSQYLYLTEKPEHYDALLSVLRCLLQPNSCYYHKKKSTSIEDEVKSKVNSNKTSKGETDQTTSQCNYTIHSVDYLNPNIKDNDTKQKEKRAEEEFKKTEESKEKEQEEIERENEKFKKEIDDSIAVIKTTYETMIKSTNKGITKSQAQQFKKLLRDLENKKDESDLKEKIIGCIPDNFKEDLRIGVDIRAILKASPSSDVITDDNYQASVKFLRGALKRLGRESSGPGCGLVPPAKSGSSNKKKCSEYKEKGEKDKDEVDIVIHVFRTPEKKQGSKDKPETCETRQSVLKQVVKGTWNNLTRKATLLVRQQLMPGGKRRTIRHNKRMKKNKKNVKRTRKRQRQNKRLHRTRKAKTTHAGRG